MAMFSWIIFFKNYVEAKNVFSGSTFIQYVFPLSLDDPACDCYEVTFEVKELRPVSGGINTLIGNNDASLVSVFKSE